MTAETQAIPTGTLKQVKISDIKIGDRFRKEMHDIPGLAESIKLKGVLQPITLSKDLQLLAGGRRVAAATIAGLEKIPALIRVIEGDIDLREIELIENIEREDFTWQEKINLIAEIDRLYKEKNTDWSGRKTAKLLDKNAMDISRALNMHKAMQIIPELGKQASASDAHKLLKKFEENAVIQEMRRRQDAKVEAAVSGKTTDETGTVFYEGPPTDALTLRLIQADQDYRSGSCFGYDCSISADIIECDPPYGIDLAANKGSKDSVDSTVHGYHEVPSEDYPEFLKALAEQLYKAAGPHCWLVFWFGPTWHYEVRESLKAAGWKVDDIPAIWSKGTGQTLSPEIYLARCYEPFFVARKGNPVFAKRGTSNVFDCLPEESGQKYHPTQRPTILIKKILQTFGLPGQTVFVPFLGSGATLRTCYELGMNGFGFDTDMKYKDKFMLAVEKDFARLQAEAMNKKD